MTSMWKRSLSMFLAVIMVVGMLPVNAFATESVIVEELLVEESVETESVETPVVENDVTVEDEPLIEEEELVEEDETEEVESDETTDDETDENVEEIVVEENSVSADAMNEAVTVEGTIDSEAELAAALAAGGKYELGADIVVNTMIAVPSGVTVTLDLAGHAITSGYQENYGAESETPKHIYPINNFGILTITDSGENGSITGRGIYVQDGSKLTLEDGAIYGIDDNGGSALYQYGGEIYITGGLVEQTADYTYNYAIYAGGGTISISGGKVVGKHGALSVSGAEATVSGGELICTGNEGWTDNVVYVSAGSITVTDGTITHKGQDVNADSGAALVAANSDVIVTIEGGSFTGLNGAISGNTNTTITGGTFVNGAYGNNHYSDVSQYVPEGYEYDAETGTITEKVFAAKIGEKGYDTVEAALSEAVDGDEVKINVAGTYSVPTGKDITITGTVDAVKFDMSNAVGVNASMTFNNVTFEYGNANYIGLQHAGTMEYNDCTINGQVFLYGTSETFNNCTFNQTSSDAYNVWTYGAKEVAFNKCTFNSAGKSVLVYNEGACATNLVVEDTTFIASAAVEGKAAIEIDTSLMEAKGHKTTTIVVDAETTADGFATGSVSGSTLWNDKKADNSVANGGTTSTVIVAGETVKKPAVTGLAGEGTAASPYLISSLDELLWFVEAVNGGNNYQGKTVKLTDDINLGGMEWTPISTFNGVFDGGNHTVSNLVITGNKSTVGFFANTYNGEIKNLTINNAKVSGYLNVGVVAGNPYTSKYTNIKVTGHVEVYGYAYVGGVGGKNAYANWTDITVDVDSTSFVKAESENYRTYVGGVIGFNGEGSHTFKNIISNIAVIGSTADIGGIFGIAHYSNNFENITFTGSVTAPEGAEEVGGIAGVWHNQKGTSVSFSNVTSSGTVTVGDVDVSETNGLTGGAYYASNDSVENSGSLIVDGNAVYPYLVSIGEEKFGSLKAAAEVAAEDDEIVLLADITVAADEAIELNGITLKGNGYSLTNNGTISFTDSVLEGVNMSGTGAAKFNGENEFNGENQVIPTTVNGGPFHLIVNKGATLLISRFVLGYDRNITVYGEIEDAHSFDPDGKTPSLQFNSTSGVSVGGTGTGNLTVENAYVELGNSSWKNASGTYEWTFKNSYVSATSFTNNNTANSGASWDVTFDNSVLAAKNYIKNGVGTTYSFTNGSVATTGSMKIDGELNIDATSSVTANAQQNNKHGAASEHEDINGTVNVAGTLNIGGNSYMEVLSGKLNVNGGTVNITSAKPLHIAADGIVNVNRGTINGDIDVTGTLSSTGNIYGTITKAGDDAVISISAGNYSQDVTEWCAEGYITVDNGDGTYKVKAANEAMIFRNGVKYYSTLADAIADAKEGETVTVIANVTVTSPITIEENITIADYGQLTVTFVDDGCIHLVDDTALTLDQVIMTAPVYADSSVVGATVNGNVVTGVVDQMSTVISDGTTVTVTNPDWVAANGDVYFMTIADAVKAAKAGDTVTIFAGEYTGDVSINKAITVIGEIDENDNNLVTVNGKLSVTGTGVTVKNVNVNNSKERAMYISGGNILIENCNLTGKHGLRYCYANNGDVTLKNCNIVGSTYGVHFDAGEGDGNVIIEGGSITGWTSFGSAIEEVTITNVEFKDGNYNLLRFFQDATVTGCTIPSGDHEGYNGSGMRIDSGDAGAGMEGITLTFNGCKTADGSDFAGAFDDGVIDNSTVVVDGKTLITPEAVINGVEYDTFEEAIAAIGEGDVVIELVADVTLDYNAREAFGTDATTSVTINGDGHTMTLNQKDSDWSSFGLANGAKLVLNDMTVEKTGYGDTSGAWNTHAINFTCPVEMNDVTVNNSMSVEAGAELNNVTINEANGYYGLWIDGNGQTVTVNGGAINATNGGRGIKIADEYVDAPASVTLNVDGTEFNTAKKAAVLVSSTAGATVTASGVDISNVAEDTVNFVWVDEDWAAYNGKVEVIGCTKAQEGIAEFLIEVKDEDGNTLSYYKTLDALFADTALPNDVTVTLYGDVVAENQVDTSDSQICYNFVSGVDSGVTMTFEYADNWNSVRHMSIGKGVTLNANNYLSIYGGVFDIYGTVNTGYAFATASAVTVKEGGVLNVTTGDKTIQVKNNSWLEVYGTVNAGTVNVWNNNSRGSHLIVSGANAQLNAEKVHAWNNKSYTVTNEIVVEKGATLSTTGLQADRGSEVTVDAATLTADTLTLGYGSNIGTLNVKNNGVITNGVSLNSTTSTVTGPEGMNVTTSIADHKVVYEEGVYKVVAKVYIAQVGENKYEYLDEAVEAAEDGATVTLLSDATGAGVVIDKNVTIDLNTYTYTVNKCVGSAGTATLGFQILKGNNVTITNGTLAATTVTEGKPVKVLVQNYANLTLSDVTLDGTGSADMQYVLSNNSGNVSITGETNITAPEGAVAFDVYDYSSAGYTVPVVKVDTTGKITGKIEASKTATLAISGGIYTVVIDKSWCADGYIPTSYADGTYGVMEAEDATVTIGDMSYASLAEAAENAKDGDEIVITADQTVTETAVIGTDVSVNLNGHTLTGHDDVYPIIRIVEDANVTIDNGTITNDDYIFVLGASDGSSAGNLTIKGGSYHGDTTVASVTKGELTIEGGEFSVDAYAGDGYQNYNFLLNCIDANYNDGSAKILVKGGSFENFNPADNAAEGLGTNYLADGYKAVTSNGSVWNVVAIDGVAEINGKAYDTVAAALADAKSGDTVTVVADSTEGTLVVAPGVTLDLNGHTVAADYVIGLNGSHVVDNTRTGLLKVAQENIDLSMNNSMLPVWNTSDGYTFTQISIVDATQGMGITWNEETDTAKLEFVTFFRDPGMLNGKASEHDVSVIVRASWTNETGTVHQDFVFSDDHVREIIDANGKRAFELTFTGYSTVNNLKLTAMVTTENGVEFTGMTYQ